jgi:hypothetical protein
MRRPDICELPLWQKELHEHFVILNAVDHNLTGQATTFLEPQMLIEPLRDVVRRSDLDGQFNNPSHGQMIRWRSTAGELRLTLAT